MDEKALKNKIILVTGASRGIGREVAKYYAKHGATVVLTARNIKLLNTLYDEIAATTEYLPNIYPLNLATASADDFLNLKNLILEKFGKLDGLLLNAGILGSLTPIEHYPIEQWYQVMQINLNSSFMLVQSLLPALKKSNSASVIFTTSDQAEKPKANWGAYAIASNGVMSLMEILSQEFSNRNIKFNSINPIAIDTNLRTKSHPAEDKNNLNKMSDLLPKYLKLML